MREANFGFRCIKLVPQQTIPDWAKAPLPRGQGDDFRTEEPCSDEEFEIYKNLYTYDKAEISSSVEASRDLSRSTFMETVSFDAAYDNERVIAHVFLPKNSVPPYQTIIYFPGDNAFWNESIFAYGYEDVEFFTKVGRAVVVPAFIGTLERKLDPPFSPKDVSPTFYRDIMFKWYRDLARVIDYMETREDIDTDRLAYMGISGSAARAVTILGVEDRIRAAILLSGGLSGRGLGKRAPEVYSLNFLPRITIPVIMLNGKYDNSYKVEANQDVMFRLFGTPKENKYHKKYETGHNVWDKKDWVRDTLTFLDKYFGQPRRQIEKKDTEK